VKHQYVIAFSVSHQYVIAFSVSHQYVIAFSVIHQYVITFSVTHQYVIAFSVSHQYVIAFSGINEYIIVFQRAYIRPRLALRHFQYPHTTITMSHYPIPAWNEHPFCFCGHRAQMSTSSEEPWRGRRLWVCLDMDPDFGVSLSTLKIVLCSSYMSRYFSDIDLTILGLRL
jgi:hypothetical protein